MDGIRYLTDEHDGRRFVQIDLDRYDRELVEDLLDGLVAESRRGEASVSLAEADAELRAAGKLDDGDLDAAGR